MATKRLHVCFPVNTLIFGGAERQLLELVKGLDTTRFKPYVVTLYPGGPLEEELAAKPEVELRSLDRKGKYDFGVLFKLVRLLRRERIDIVQPFLTPASFFGLTAALLAGTPIKIVTERSGVRKRQHMGYRLYRFTEDRLTAIADAAVPNSQAGREFLLERGIAPSKIRVIYNGINEDRLRWDPAAVAEIRQRLNVPPDGYVIGTVASLSPQKDHLTLLKAVVRIKRRVPGVRVALVGDGPLRGELESAVKELGLEGHVAFFGNQHQVANYLAALDLAVLPSVDHEGCSNFLLESMFLGKAVVATDIGGNREVVTTEENGLLVPPRNPAAMAAAVVELLTDGTRRQRMGARGMAMVKARFSLPGMVKQYEDLYLELARKKGLLVPVDDKNPVSGGEHRHEPSTADGA